MPDHAMPKTLPGIDLADGLNRVCGNWEVYRLILLHFYDKQHDAAQRLEILVTENQWEEAQHLAHTLKGSGGNLGAKRLYEQAAAMEQACCKADTHSAQITLTPLRSCLEEVIGGLARLNKTVASAADPITEGHIDVEHKTLAVEIADLLDKLLSSLDRDLGEAQACLADLRCRTQGGALSASLSALAQALSDYDIDAAKEIGYSLHKDC